MLQFAPNSSVISRFRNVMAAPPTTSSEVTTLLIRWGNGDALALDKLLPLVYEELRVMARQHLRKEHPGQTLQTTDLVHEAYLKLVNQRRVHWQNRAQLLCYRGAINATNSG
jgi:hypothetical protein